LASVQNSHCEKFASWLESHCSVLAYRIWVYFSFKMDKAGILDKKSKIFRPQNVKPLGQI